MREETLYQFEPEQANPIGEWPLFTPGKVVPVNGLKFSVSLCGKCGAQVNLTSDNFCSSCGNRVRETCAYCCQPLKEEEKSNAER